METSGQRGTESAARVADVLLAFLGEPASLGVSSIALELGLSKAVVHRILQTLVQRRLLVADPVERSYRLGPAASALGARALRQSDLRTSALPLLRELQGETNETATVSALIPRGRVYLDQVVSQQEIKMTVEIGRRFPLHAGSSGTCVLAFLDEDEREAILSEPLARLTKLTVVDARTLRGILEGVRHQGYAVSHGERQEGAGSIAAPVFGFDGRVLGAISVCGPTPRVDARLMATFAPLVVRAATRVSRSMGWNPDLSGAPATGHESDRAIGRRHAFGEDGDE